MHLFQPKHQKLILQCYPPGRGFDKKPNSSELSYLLYYASTRRVKLEKVFKFLQKKNDSDVYRNRTGNVQVTLEIIHSLIKKCPDDLNVFAANVNAILLSVLKTKDLSLCQHAEPVFHDYCATLDGELFSGDLEFVHSFTTLSQSFLNLGINVSEANTIQWKAISLKSAGSIAQCKNVSQSNNAIYIVKAAVALLCSEIKTNVTEENLIQRTLSHSSETQHLQSEKQAYDLSRFNTARTSNVKREDFDSQTPDEIELEELAISSLRNFFNASSSIKLTSGTVALAEYLVKCKVDPKWSAALIEMIITWVPVQLRFIVLSILTTRLDENGHKAEQLIYIHSVSSLLSSSVNLVGLPVIDNLKQFVRLQKYHITDKPDARLVLEYTSAIESLATHVYYQDQITDIAVELLAKAKESNSDEFTLAILNDISKVLNRSYKTKSVQRAIVPIEIFADTFHLLRCENPQIQTAYVALLEVEIDLEYREESQYLKADHDGLISSSKASVLNIFYEQLEGLQCIYSKGSFLNLLELINLKFGINSIINFIPFFFQWQLKNNAKGEFSKKEILLDNIAFANLYICAKGGEFDELLDEVLSRISWRKANRLWEFEGFPADEGALPSELTLSKGQFAELISISPLKAYEDIIFSTHYRYIIAPLADDEIDAEGHDQDQSFSSNNHNHNVSQNLSFAMYLQSSKPSSIRNPNETNSIRSMPLSARSIMFNGKLNVPKVQDLRKAISGNTQKRTLSSNTSFQKTDVATLLNDLKIGSELEDRGNLTSN